MFINHINRDAGLSTGGQAALHLAVDAGAFVTATTRTEERSESFRKFDKVFYLIGNSVLVRSIAFIRAGGRLMQAGWLGELAPIVAFNPLVKMESGVHFRLFNSKVLGTPDFPISGYSLQEIVKKIERGEWNAKPSKVFNYDQIHDAHRCLDAHNAGGKVVVKQ